MQVLKDVLDLSTWRIIVSKCKDAPPRVTSCNRATFDARYVSVCGCLRAKTCCRTRVQGRNCARVYWAFLENAATLREEIPILQCKWRRRVTLPSETTPDYGVAIFKVINPSFIEINSRSERSDSNNIPRLIPDLNYDIRRQINGAVKGMF